MTCSISRIKEILISVLVVVEKTAFLERYTSQLGKILTVDLDVSRHHRLLERIKFWIASDSIGDASSSRVRQKSLS